MKKAYDNRNLKKIPKKLMDLLNSVEYDYPTQGNHEDIYNAMLKVDANPCSIILFCQQLDGKHWNKKKFMKISREQIWSEVRETINKYFYNEIDKRMSKYLENHKDPKDEYLNKLIKEYEPQAIEILKGQKRKFDLEKAKQSRFEIIRERVINIPKPFNQLYSQYYVIPELKDVRRGSGSGSHTRYNHSRYGFAFALYNRKKKIPTHILVYDKHNELKLLASLNNLCLEPGNLGSNYHLKKEEEYRILKGVWFFRARDINRSFSDSKFVISDKRYY